MGKAAPPLASMKDIGWTYWQALCAGDEPPDIHPAFAPIGFYRYDITDNRNGHRSTVVAIWDRDGRGNPVPKSYKVGKGAPIGIGTPEAEEDFCYKTFARFARKAIPHPLYLEWLRTGEFPKSEVEQAAENSRAVVGNNSGATPFEVFNDQAATLLAAVEKAKVIENDEQASAAQTLRNRLTEVASEGDEQRAAEKEPHLRAGQAVDAQWNPRIKELKGAATSIRQAQEAFATKKAKAKKAEIERRAATSNPVIPSAAPEKIEAAHGKSSTVKTVRKPTVRDYGLLYEKFKDNPDVKYAVEAALDKIVAKVYAVLLPGMDDLPGVTSEEVAKIGR